MKKETWFDKQSLTLVAGIQEARSLCSQPKASDLKESCHFASLHIHNYQLVRKNSKIKLSLPNFFPARSWYFYPPTRRPFYNRRGASTRQPSSSKPEHTMLIVQAQSILEFLTNRDQVKKISATTTSLSHSTICHLSLPRWILRVHLFRNFFWSSLNYVVSFKLPVKTVVWGLLLDCKHYDRSVYFMILMLDIEVWLRNIVLYW